MFAGSQEGTSLFCQQASGAGGAAFVAEDQRIPKSVFRAVQTAQAIGMPVTILPDLREMYAGEWDGLTFEEIRQRYPELYAARAKDLTIPLPGSESYEDGIARFSAAMNAAAETASGDFAVVAHGGILAQFLQSVSGNWYKPDYTEIVTLTYQNGIFTLQED